MGCKQSAIKGGDYQAINPDHLPPVPVDSWYAQPFTEASTMEMTSFHEKRKGELVFSVAQIPTRAAELDRLPNRGPELRQVFLLGDDPIYGMGYLHNTALFIEHYWRTRVTHDFAGNNKFDRPFYDMLLGVKVFINNKLVPDQFVAPDSLLQCTATLRANEATTTWLCVPLVLFTPTDPSQVAMFNIIELYRPLAMNFARAAATLLPGEHTVRVEIVYGCRSEGNFCTDFISRGTFKLLVDEASKAKVAQFVVQLGKVMREADERAVAVGGSQVNSSSASKRVAVIPNPNPSESSHACAYCSGRLKFRCTICGAAVCGSTSCVWSKFVGYPNGCSTHMAQ